MTKIGINFRFCPRVDFHRRTYQAVMLADPVDATRRRITRYSSLP
jgi:hypothetical protein